jgi:ribosomal-protein-alanine N-acetyltransferase
MTSLLTERLRIRDHVPEDLITHHELLSDRESMKYLPDIMTKSLEASKANLDTAIDESRLENRRRYFFRIEDTISGAFIGEIGYTVAAETPFGKLVDLGYFIKKEYWGKGYTAEALKRVMAFAFEENNVYRIYTGCLKENAGSERVMLKCGMIKEAEHKAAVLHDGKLKDRVEYRLLKYEWEAGRASCVRNA